MYSVHREKQFILGRLGEKSTGGFALVAAVLVIFILNALGMLVFSLSTQDIRISSRMVGEKKAFSSAEAGIHWVTQIFDPDTFADIPPDNFAVDLLSDPDSYFSVVSVSRPTQGPEILPLPGYSVAGGQQWGQNRYRTSVAGANSRYNSRVQMEASLGFGPVELTTTYR
jgi:hypothetical protein